MKCRDFDLRLLRRWCYQICARQLFRMNASDIVGEVGRYVGGWRQLVGCCEMRKIVVMKVVENWWSVFSFFVE